MANFTEHELEEIVREMGQNVENQAQMHRLKNEIDRYLNEEPYTSEDDDDILNQSLFASLSIDPAAQFVRQQPKRSQESIQSPIVSRRRRGKFTEYENIEYPDDFDEETPTEYPEAQTLISQAYQSIGRIYDTCRSVAKAVDDLSITSGHSEGSGGSGGSRGPRTSVTPESEVVLDEDESSISLPGSTRSDHSAPPQYEILDPSVRKVQFPQPGRAPYKFDPVTRYHLYKEEWDRHLIPGEMRRLTGRWGIREYMFRNDVPRLLTNPDGHAEHPKDWSPRPYLD